RVTSLEYSARLAANFARQHGSKRTIHGTTAEGAKAAAVPVRSEIVIGDATRLPFAAAQFSAVLAVLMLHHLPSHGAQDRAFSEPPRVLERGGVFIASEIHARWLQRWSLSRSTFPPPPPERVGARLAEAGFATPLIDSQKQGFRVLAARADRQIARIQNQ